jgi:hypothetical protein
MPGRSRSKSPGFRYLYTKTPSFLKKEEGVAPRRLKLEALATRVLIL